MSCRSGAVQCISRVMCWFPCLSRREVSPLNVQAHTRMSFVKRSFWCGGARGCWYIGDTLSGVVACCFGGPYHAANLTQCPSGAKIIQQGFLSRMQLAAEKDIRSDNDPGIFSIALRSMTDAPSCVCQEVCWLPAIPAQSFHSVGEV